MKYQIVTSLLFICVTTTHQYLLAAQKGLTDQVVYSCNFENDTCQMKIDPSPSGFTWLRASGSTPSETTGPDFDHTTLTVNGYYMYTEATDFNPGEVSKLRIPPLMSQPQGSMCLTFWCHMYGGHIGTLNVTQDDLTVLSSISFNQSDTWFQQNVTIKVPSAGALAFVGVRGGFDIGQPYGDIAIDDVVVYNEPCEYETTTEEITTATTTTIVTSTEASTSTIATTLVSTSVTTEAAPRTATINTTQQVVVATQPGVASTEAFEATSQILKSSLTSELKDGGSQNSSRLSQDSSLTTGLLVAMTTSNNDSSTSSQVITTDRNVTQLDLLSTKTVFNTASLDSNNTLYNYSMNQTVSPAAVVITSNSTMPPILNLINSTSDNSTELMSTVNSSLLSVSKFEYGQPTSAMQIDPQSQESSSKKIWNLTEQNLILILAFLSACILILLLVIGVLACCLSVTRRKYNVERSTNVYNSNTTLDSSSVGETQRVAARKGYADYS